MHTGFAEKRVRCFFCALHLIRPFLAMAMIKASLSLLIWLNENVQSLLSLLPEFIYLLKVLFLVRVEPFDVVSSL